MVDNQKGALDEARAAFSCSNFREALEKYEYFFDHALDDDPHSLYGVRLSYCLNEWVRLGEKYPEALTKLEMKRDEALELLYKTRDPERFHDYMAICKYLKSPELPISEFVRMDSEDKDLANLTVRFVWDSLVARKKWTVCISYLDDPLEKYESSILKFDEAMTVCKSDPGLGGGLAEQIKSWYVRDVSNILIVLKNCNKVDDFLKIRERVSSDLGSRGYSALEKKIDGKIAL